MGTGIHMCSIQFLVVFRVPFDNVQCRIHARIKQIFMYLSGGTQRKKKWIVVAYIL